MKLSLRDADVAKFVTRRVPGLKELDSAVLRLIKARALEHGYFAFLRELCPRIAALAGDGPITPDIIATAVGEEVANR